MNCEAS